MDILIALSLCETHLVLVNNMFSISMCVCIISLRMFDSKKLMTESQPTKTDTRHQNTPKVNVANIKGKVFFFFFTFLKIKMVITEM